MLTEDELDELWRQAEASDDEISTKLVEQARLAIALQREVETLKEQLKGLGTANTLHFEENKALREQVGKMRTAIHDCVAECVIDSTFRSMTRAGRAVEKLAKVALGGAP